MIPQTFPSRVDSTTNQTIWQVNVVLDVTGLKRWVDYIPVQIDATNDNKNSYGNNDVMLVEQNSAGTRVFAEGTVRWSANEDGYIPIDYFGS